MRLASGLTTLVAVLTWSVLAHAQQSDSSAPNVTVATIGTQVVSDRGRYVGRVQAVSTVNIVARVEGVLTTKNFEEGGFVAQGDLLYEIEKGLYQADVDKAKAQLEGAQASLKDSSVNLERQKILLSKGDVAQSVVDSATAQVGADEANAGEAAASLDTANINLGYTDIYSPIDGRIGVSNVDVGNLVNSNSGTLTTVTSVDPINVSFYVGEKDLIEDRKAGLIENNSAKLTVSLTLSDGSAYAETGTINYVGTTVEQSSDTVELRASFANPDNILLPNQFVNVRLADSDPQPVIVVPQPAVQLDSKGHFVYTVDSSDTVERKDIVLGAQTSGFWTVTSGLAEGDKVVVQGLQRVSPGTKVNPTELQKTAG